MNVKFALTPMAVVLCALAAATSGAVLAEVRSLAMLDRVEAGEWELRSREQGQPPRRLCMRDARQLIQLRHAGENCQRTVVDDTADQITVQYTCHGRGYGRTQIRRESESLVQIDTQGIAAGRPFAFAIEARRVGGCGA